MQETIQDMMAGAIMLSAWAIALFFFRFFRKTRDWFFVWFAGAFLLLGIERIVISTLWIEAHSTVFLLRLAAFLTIILAIVTKNRRPI